MPRHGRTTAGRARRAVRHVTAAIARFRPALIPLISIETGNAELIGTAVGVRAGDTRLVLSAAHVLRRFAGATIHVPGNSGLRPLAGITHLAATAPINCPDDDTVDAAVLVVDGATAGNWAGWLEPDDLLPGAPDGPSDRYIITGFPRSTASRSEPATVPPAWRYAGKPAARSRYDDALARPSLHIAIDYSQRSVVRNDRTVPPPALYGTSGGMLIWAPSLQDSSQTLSNRLAGIFIEEHVAPANLLISTRIDVHLALIHDRLPELRQYFPLPRTVFRRPPWRSPRSRAILTPRSRDGVATQLQSRGSGSFIRS